MGSRSWHVGTPIAMTHQLHQYLGGKIFLDIDESPMMRARIEGTYEPFKTRMIQRLLQPGMTYVDIGTNKGYFAVLAARLLHGTGQVLAFEPEPWNCRCVRHSIDANAYANIRLFELAVGDANKVASLHLGNKSGWHSILPNLPQCGRDTIEVQQRCLDSILDELEVTQVDVVKIDVEGVELRVLDGARETLTRNSDIVLLMDLHPYLGTSSIAVCDFLQDLGFQLYEMNPPHRSLAVSEGITVLYAARRAPGREGMNELNAS